MRKIFTTLAALFTFSTALAFSDVDSNNSHAAAIEYLARHAVIGGFPDGQFKPQQRLTRAELAKIVTLVRGENPSPLKFNACFSDVASKWFAPFVCFAKNENWIGGYSDGTFRPGAEVNRAEAAKIILNTLGVGLDASATFADVDADEWFAPFADTIRARNLFDDTTFSPAQKITRGEAVEIIFRALVTKNSGESKYTATLVENFDSAIAPAKIVASTLDFANSAAGNFNITKWKITNGEWAMQPKLEFNGRIYLFATLEEYIAALEIIRNHFDLLDFHNFDEKIARFISEFENVSGSYSKNEPTVLISLPTASFAGNSAVGVAANFTNIDLADESAVAALGGASTQFGDSKIYIGYEVVPPLNKNPVLVSFTYGKQNWVRRDYETSADESVGYGLLAAGENLFAVFTSRGTDGLANFDFRRFAKNGWLSEYGAGRGEQIAVIAKISPTTGDVLAATFLSSQLDSGETNALTVTDLARSGTNLVVSAEAWFAPRRTSRQPMQQKFFVVNEPFEYEIEFTSDMQSAVRAEAPGFGQ